MRTRLRKSKYMRCGSSGCGRCVNTQVNWAWMLKRDVGEDGVVEVVVELRLVQLREVAAERRALPANRRRRWRRAPRRPCVDRVAGRCRCRSRKYSLHLRRDRAAPGMARARLRFGKDHAAVALVAVVDGVDVVGELERPGVRRHDVVRLVEGVDRGLPVARHLDRDVVARSPTPRSDTGRGARG